MPETLEYQELGRGDRLTLACFALALVAPLLLWLLPMPWSIAALIALVVAALLAILYGPDSRVCLDQKDRMISHLTMGRRATVISVDDVVEIRSFRVPYGPRRLYVRDSRDEHIEFAVNESSRVLRVALGSLLIGGSVAAEMDRKTRLDLGLD